MAQRNDRADASASKRTSVIRRQRVALLDLPWVLLEGRPQRMHIAGVLLCRKPLDAGPHFVGRLVAEMRRHEQATPPLDRRLARGVLGRYWPRWETGHLVDLDYHLHETSVPAPGGTAALEDLVARLHEQPLDMNRPPWQVHVIDDVADNRFAIYAKFHHAVTDGVGAIRILQAVLATEPSEEPTLPLWAGRPKARGAERLGSSGGPRVVTKAPRALRLIAQARRSGPRARPYDAPRSIVNGAVTTQRRIATRTLVTARLKELATAIDGTINDALLAICATGLRTCLLDLDALPRRSLTAAVPTSLRPAAGAPERGHAGNALSFAFASLATDIADPRQRSQLVIDSIRDAKRFLTTVPEDLRDTYTALTMTPFIAGQLVGLGAVSPPMFNVAISNFAGPRTPHYYGRAAVESIYPVSILQSGQALNITALSYADNMHVTFTACPAAIPHLARLADSCVRAVDELLAAYATPRPGPVAFANRPTVLDRSTPAEQDQDLAASMNDGSETHMPDLDDLKNAADDHDDQVDQGLEKAGDAVGDRVGHQDQIDSAVDKGQDATGDGNSTDQ